MNQPPWTEKMQQRLSHQREEMWQITPLMQHQNHHTRNLLKKTNTFWKGDYIMEVYSAVLSADCSIDLANCMPPFLLWPPAKDFPLLLTPILPSSLMQEVTSTPNHSVIYLADCGTALRGKFQDVFS